ncbi:MAG: hypothetical protein Q4C83_00055 [Candidatus Saccharibacteria bacterium]|nr:hypothetical protein [Candidatus Saccharibacteria bacterium]
MVEKFNQYNRNADNQNPNSEKESTKALRRVVLGILATTFLVGNITSCGAHSKSNEPDAVENTTDYTGNVDNSNNDEVETQEFSDGMTLDALREAIDSDDIQNAMEIDPRIVTNAMKNWMQEAGYSSVITIDSYDDGQTPIVDGNTSVNDEPTGLEATFLGDGFNIEVRNKEGVYFSEEMDYIPTAENLADVVE